MTQGCWAYLPFAYVTLSFSVNCILSYHITGHASQFTNKLASDKMEACLAMKGFVFPAGWNTSSLFRKHHSGPIPGLFAEGRGLSCSQQPITLLSAGS